MGSMWVSKTTSGKVHWWPSVYLLSLVFLCCTDCYKSKNFMVEMPGKWHPWLVFCLDIQNSKEYLTYHTYIKHVLFQVTVGWPNSQHSWKGELVALHKTTIGTFQLNIKCPLIFSNTKYILSKLSKRQAGNSIIIHCHFVLLLMYLKSCGRQDLIVQF